METEKNAYFIYFQFEVDSEEIKIHSALFSASFLALIRSASIKKKPQKTSESEPSEEKKGRIPTTPAMVA